HPFHSVSNESIARIPTLIGSEIGGLVIGLGGALSVKYVFNPLGNVASFNSLPNASTTCPTKLRPTLIDKGFPVASTRQPGPISVTSLYGIKMIVSSLKPTTSEIFGSSSVVSPYIKKTSP